MQIRGSKWSMNTRRRKTNPLRLIFLLALVAGAVYVLEFIVPTTQPLFIPTPTPTRSPDSYISDAQALVSAGKYAQAIEAYMQAVKSDPQNPANYLAMSLLQIYTGRYQEGLTSAENALLINPSLGQAHALRGWALGFLEDYLPAQTALEQAISLEPNNGTYFAYLAEVQANYSQTDSAPLGLLDKGAESSRTAQRLAPNSLETHRARGIVLEYTGNTTEAITEFEAAIAINPNIADLHLALGRNYRAVERWQDAVDEFNRANSLNPLDPLPLTYIARTYYSLGEYPRAVQYAEDAVKVAPADPFMHGNWGVMLRKNGDLTGAVRELRLAVRGGTTDDGVTVEGLKLSNSFRIIEYYSAYGLALAETGECGEALQLSQLLQNAVATDQTAQLNAQAIIDICTQYSSNGTPTASVSESPLTEGPPAPEVTLTP